MVRSPCPTPTSYSSRELFAIFRTRIRIDRSQADLIVDATGEVVTPGLICDFTFLGLAADQPTLRVEDQARYGRWLDLIEQAVQTVPSTED
jgi:hypothetical protein